MLSHLCPSTEIKDQKKAMEQELQISLGPSYTAAKHRYTKPQGGQYRPKLRSQSPHVYPSCAGRSL